MCDRVCLGGGGGGRRERTRNLNCRSLCRRLHVGRRCFVYIYSRFEGIYTPKKKEIKV